MVLSIVWQLSVNNFESGYIFTNNYVKLKTYFAMKRREAKSEDRKVWRLSWNECAEPKVPLREARAAMGIADVIHFALQNKIVWVNLFIREGIYFISNETLWF